MNWSLVYRIAEEEVERCAMLPGHYDDTFAAGALWGAGWMAAVIGMAEAIQRNHAPSPFAAYLAERAAAEGRARGGWESQPSSAEKGPKP